MALDKITYGIKSNLNAVTDASKQATAEDFNEIKSVVNDAIDAIDQVAPTAVASATYTVLSADKKLHVIYTATGACIITIPTALITTTFDILIKDGAGNAAINDITIATEGAETIDGEATLVIGGNYDAINLYSNGTNLFTY